MKLRLDSGKCVGHGRCYDLAPEAFGEDERGLCLILHENVPEDLRDKARTAANNCPEKAILIDED